MRKIARSLMILLSVSLFLGGCSKTIQEQKSTAADPGSITQVKFTGSNVKVVHDF